MQAYILEFLDTRENGLSRILAWLLDPKGSHAQGHRFLAAFLEWLELGPEWVSTAHVARVWLEVPTLSGTSVGYLDILIRCGGRAIAIENKPFAEDQPRQVERYLDDLARQCPDGHCLLYLSGLGHKPGETSISAKRADSEQDRHTLIVRGYPGLVDWLETCIGLCRAPTVSMMLDGLIRHVRREFMGVGDINEAQDLARKVCENPQTLDAALAIVEAAEPIHDRLIAGVVERVREAVDARPGWHLLRANLSAASHSGLLISFAEDSSIGFGFQFDKPRHGYLFYGVASEKMLRLPQGTKAAVARFLGTQEGTDYWPVWKAVGPNDRHFRLSLNADRHFWLAAQSGELAAMLIHYVEEVENLLRKEGLLDAVRQR